MSHKPWESPADYHGFGANAYDGDDGKERADKNLQRFLEAHLVTVSPWVEGKEKGTAKTVQGEGKARELWWETKDGKRFIMPDNVEVDRVASQVANGELVSLASILVSNHFNLIPRTILSHVGIDVANSSTSGSSRVC